MFLCTAPGNLDGIYIFTYVYIPGRLVCQYLGWRYWAHWFLNNNSVLSLRYSRSWLNYPNKQHGDFSLDMGVELHIILNIIIIIIIIIIIPIITLFETFSAKKIFSLYECSQIYNFRLWKDNLRTLCRTDPLGSYSLENLLRQTWVPVQVSSKGYNLVPVTKTRKESMIIILRKRFENNAERISSGVP